MQSNTGLISKAMAILFILLNLRSITTQTPAQTVSEAAATSWPSKAVWNPNYPGVKFDHGPLTLPVFLNVDMCLHIQPEVQVLLQPSDASELAAHTAIEN